MDNKSIVEFFKDEKNPLGIDTRSGNSVLDLRRKEAMLRSGAYDAEKVASNIALGLEDLESRQSNRQAFYENELINNSDPFSANIARLREKELIDQLYSRAMGRQENIGDIESRILSNKAASDFQRSLGPNGSSVNPLLRAREVQSYSKEHLSGSEIDSAKRRIEGILNSREKYLESIDRIRERDNRARNALIEAKFEDQRQLENLQSHMTKNINQSALSAINEHNNKKQAESENKSAMIGSGINAAAIIAASMLSDKNTKKNVKDGKGSIDIILETVGPVEYEYKDEYKDDSNAGRGKHLGVMAQDMEKAGLDGIVMIDPLTGMKVIDTVKMIPLLLAAQSRLNEKIDEKQDKKSNKGGNKK